MSNVGWLLFQAPIRSFELKAGCHPWHVQKMTFTPAERVMLSATFRTKEFDTWLSLLQAGNWRVSLLSYLNLNKGWLKNRDLFWKFFEYLELVPKKIAHLLILDLQEKKLRRMVWRVNIA